MPLQMGGNSLQAGAVCARVRAALQLEHPVPITWLMQSQTITALAARLTEVADATEMDQPTSVPRLVATLSSGDGASAVAPLTFQQEQFYQLWNRDRSSAAYNSGFMMVLHGPLDAVALQAAVQLVFERQQSLRTNFLLDELEVPMQRIGAVPSKADCLRIEQPPSGFTGLNSMADGSFFVTEGAALPAWILQPCLHSAQLSRRDYMILAAAELLHTDVQARRCTSCSWHS